MSDSSNSKYKQILESIIKQWAQDHAPNFIVSDPNLTPEAMNNTSGFFTWVVREGHVNIDLANLAYRLEMYLESQRKDKVTDGMFCVNCGDFFKYAEANQEDGSMICYSCRQSPYI